MMLLVMFSLAGIPPTIGFYAKFSVIEAAVNAGFTWLAVVAVMASLVGAFYYLRIVKLMYFDDATDTAPIVARLDNRVLLSVNGLALLLFGILPQPLMGWCVVALLQLRLPVGRSAGRPARRRRRAKICGSGVCTNRAEPTRSRPCASVSSSPASST